MKKVFIYHNNKDITEYVIPTSFKIANTLNAKAFSFDVPSEFLTVRLHERCELRDESRIIVAGHIASLRIKSMLMSKMTDEEYAEMFEDDEEDEDDDSDMKEVDAEIVFIYEVVVTQI